MFSLLKNVKWFEWVLVGVLVVVISACAILWKSYNDARDLQAATKADNTVLTQTVEHQDRSAKVTDEVVAQFSQDQQTAIVERDKERREVINEYIDHATTKTPVPRTEVDSGRGTRVEVVVDDPSDRLRVLANRMHEQYCKAAPKRGVECSTASTNQ